jgi:hypothetical protein
MQTQSQFVDIYRSMARAGTESAKAALQNTERLHQQQLQIVRSALEHNMKAANQLAEVRSMDELFSMQSQLIGTQVAQGLEMWRTMLRLFGDGQMTWLSQMQTQVGQATDTVRQAYDLTARATEDATRSAVSHVSGVANAAREASTQAQERRPQEQQHRKSA